jgi:hypothetical protein
MTIKLHNVGSATEAFAILEQTPNNNIRFRGQRDANWKLRSTLARHRRSPVSPNTTLEIDSMIDHFLVNLASIGIHAPFNRTDRRARLEFARHYGVPSPLIDFSLSPYVALFFAFNGVRPSEAKADDHAAVYCLNINDLAGVWASASSRDIHGKVDGKEFARRHNDFMFDTSAKYEETYPIGTLDYLDMPASWNRRMQRQLGGFLYDTLNYDLFGCSDLETFMEQKEIEGPDSLSSALLTKVVIPHGVGREIFERLEIMGVTATLLFEDHEGAATDVINAYNYGRRTGRAWDLRTW